ncbi:HAMP domain-containing sensor histidine kinase [Paenibacillus favisporus]|uniref:sensor histidine kinase n=1 Tax=Paenibacillus TaxID=44249 RepID=UPI00190B8F40|nr:MULTISPECIES: HAMP domain-containing sensor histidine kinase [Paenibacillus]MBJ9992568.1 HAMP domain-containing histidine kinase [Paenibacillus sp. S28]MEC0178675.1 HAMP domain-containing sensor histidine kinase [Paenibacillus favisporus]
MIKKGIRRQIVLHYFIVVFSALLLAEVIFLLAIRTYYYDSIYSHIKNHIDNVEDYYYQRINPGLDGNRDLASMLTYYDLNSANVQILDTQGNVLINSSEFQPDMSVKTADISQALSGNVGRWVGRQASTGENVMAVSKLEQSSGQDGYIVRYVTSLETVNDKLFNLTMLATGVGAAVLAIVLVFSMGLANSIVQPLNTITAVSAEMARGKFNQRIKGDYKYELGELASTLNYMAQEIVRSNQVKDDFISSISHELRTPLTSIKGWSETINSGGYDPEETRIGMEIITKETERLIGLVEEILDFSKLQQNEMKIAIGRVDIKELLQEIMLNLWTKAESRQIELRLKSEDRPLVAGDANRLKQVFLNLVDNAIKFSHEHSAIDLVVYFEGDNVVTEVRDTGIGISEDHLVKVRDRFFQVDPLNGGTGLGLAISQQLVELHKGILLIQSTLGEGTTIVVSLPRLPENTAQTDGTPELPPADEKLS